MPLDSAADTEEASNRIVEARRARLKAAIRAAGGNQVVAELSGVKLGTLNEYIGGRDLRLSFADAIARACNVSLQWLATGEGPMARLDLPSDAVAHTLLRTVNTDRLATAIALIDRKLPARASVRDRAVAIVTLYDIILPMDDDQVASLFNS